MSGTDPDEGETWPTWLTPEAFAAWYIEENRRRLLDHDEQLPNVPAEICDKMGLFGPGAG